MMPTRHHASACQGGPDTDTRESDQQKSGVANSQLCFPKWAVVSKWYATLRSSTEHYCNFEIQFVNVWKLQKGQITKVLSPGKENPMLSLFGSGAMHPMHQLSGVSMP